jgi:hypothetical protein
MPLTDIRSAKMTENIKKWILQNYLKKVYDAKKCVAFEDEQRILVM